MWSRIRRSVVSVLHIPAIKRGNWQPLFMIFSFKTSLIWHFQPCLITRGYNSSAPKDCKVMGVWGGSHGRGWHHRAEELCKIEYWVTGETATEIPILVRMTSPTTTLAYIRWKTNFFFKSWQAGSQFLLLGWWSKSNWHIFSCSGARGVDTTVCITGLTTATL